MSITRNDIETVRDVAVACALTTDFIRLHLDRSGQDNIPLDHPLISNALEEIHRVQQRLSALDPDLTMAVLHVLRVANPYNDKQPEFFGRKFPTFHELAMAIPDLGSTVLAGLLQEIAANKPYPINMLGLMGWQRSQPEEGDFYADKVVPAIEQEASAALQPCQALKRCPPSDLFQQLHSATEAWTRSGTGISRRVDLSAMVQRNALGANQERTRETTFLEPPFWLFGRDQTGRPALCRVPCTAHSSQASPRPPCDF